MKTLHICLDADNLYCYQISPDPDKYEYAWINGSGFPEALIEKHGDHITIVQLYGCEILKELYRINIPIDRPLDELELKHFRKAWTLCFYAKVNLRRYNSRISLLWTKVFFTLVLREPYLRDLFTKAMESPEFPSKHILKPNLVAPGPVAVEFLEN